MVMRGGPTHPSIYDPLGHLHFRSRVHLFASVAAIPHTAAGVLAFSCIVVVCASWPSSSNVVLLGVLLSCIWAWSRAPVSPRPPDPRPLLSARAAALLTAWAGTQLVFSYMLQIPQLAHVLGPAVLRALNVGVFTRLQSGVEIGLMITHGAALALLYLMLIALRCACDNSTRSWPSVGEVVSSVQTQLSGEAAARQAQAAEVRRAGAAHRAALASPMVNRLSSLEPQQGPLRLAAQREASVSQSELLQRDGAAGQPPEWMWHGSQAAFCNSGRAQGPRSEGGAFWDAQFADPSSDLNVSDKVRYGYSCRHSDRLDK